ncbi:MAG TPA: phage tail assembly chaperone [Allosphingosinicella sp.]
MAGALLGWQPDEFWSATPDELAAVIEAVAGRGGGGEPMGRAELERLERMFPDG